MAARKPLFMSTDGYAEEMALADSATFGGLTLLAAIAMGGFKITGLGEPTLAQDAATKNYVDAVASGLSVHAAVRLTTAAALPANTQAGTGVGATLTADANGALTVDGVLVAVNDRILVKDEATGEDNGIYIVTDTGDGSNPYILTRATDIDTDPETTSGSYTFTLEGTANAGFGYALTTLDPIVVDTTVQTWTIFTSAATYTFDQGLSRTLASIKVELDTAAAAQTAGAGGGSSGLEFDANSAAGKLRAAVHATGGLERTGTGLAAKLNGTTLESAAGGLSVKGLPSLFEINGVATVAGVSAANLATLVNGSNADALHVHASAAATEAPKVENTLAVVEAVAVADPVYQSSTSAQVGKADAGVNAKAYVIGIARTAQGTIGQTSEVVTDGIAAGVLTGATPGTQYYLQDGGGLGTAVPGAGKRIISMGFAHTATDLFVRITDYGKRAA